MSQVEIAERGILERMLLNVAEKRRLLRPREMTLATFAAMKGVEYHQELMVMGRAPNSWGKPCQTADFADPAVRKKTVEAMLHTSEPHSGCPMRWVTGDTGSLNAYTRRSAFWRVIQAVVRKLAIADVETPGWPSSLVWTNIYKLAPYEGGNPSARLCRFQSPECLQLLELEIAEWKPKRLLVLTGLDWAEGLLERLHAIETASVGGRFVDRIADLALDDSRRDVVRCVVAKHPQGKPEEPMVEEVVAAFRR